MGELSKEDIHVWQTLYWPNNGTRMNSQQALDAMMNHRPKWELINALLDKYNEDHHLLGVCFVTHSLLPFLLLYCFIVDMMHAYCFSILHMKSRKLWLTNPIFKEKTLLILKKRKEKKKRLCIWMQIILTFEFDCKERTGWHQPSFLR